MLKTKLKLKKSGKPYSCQRVIYNCDECEIEVYTQYNVYLRKKNKVDYCSSCKQKGKRAPNYGRTGKRNYFYGKKHTEETKKKISDKQIGQTYIISLPNTKYPNLIGILKYKKSTNKPICFQEVIRKCNCCGKKEKKNFTYFKTKNQFNFCKSCVSKNAGCGKQAIKWVKNNPEKVKEINRKITRNMETRIKRSCLNQDISIEKFKGFTKKEKNEKEYFKNKDKYDIWRIQVFERDNYTCKFPKCTFCKNKRGSIVLASHHIYPKKKFPEKKFYVNNGITVCDLVHKRILNGREEKYIKLLIKLL